MTAGARLLTLRLQGFKSFADRTTVEFGGGISAVVGPNGSGKSNLADALRWALGEQGRALRSRRAEDVIFAGSERRAALGMADVALVLDNADGLLPVDYSALELGRRLYRSGENDYLLNRQRVRLRDLVDLLDAANLADNAFLFIGQGMVDQALSLRPEERRPLFEEVAGVRRHERRRRKAEDQLTESEANLARVEDILAELRPQARRLAAQAEQQASRTNVAAELAAALLASTHARWHEAAARVTAAATARGTATLALDAGLAALARAEGEASAVAADLEARAAAERERRAAHDSAREVLTQLRLREAALASELGAVDRDRQRLTDERSAAEADLAIRRRAAAAPVPPRDVGLEAAAAEAEAALSDALRELGELRAASRARGDELEALRRAEAARQAEAETARRRLAEAERRLDEERGRDATIRGRLEELEARHRSAAAARTSAAEAETEARAAGEAARRELEAAEARRAAASEAASSARTSVNSLAAHLAALDARLREDEERGIARAARRRGGRRIDEDLTIDAGLRAAVEAVLADAARGYLVGSDAVAALAGERGVLVVDDAGAERHRPARSGDVDRVLARVAAMGGGRLDAAVTRDPLGAATRLLGRAVWVPTLEDALALRSELPVGWVAVPRDGSAVVADATITLGRPDGSLERRAERTRLATELERADAAAASAATAAEDATASAEAARARFTEIQRRESAADAARRKAEEAERITSRELETVVRELAWHGSQLERLAADAARARAALPSVEAAPGPSGDGAAASGTGPDEGAIATWERRVAELRARRDRLAADLTVLDAARREAEASRAGAAAAIAAGEERIARADAEAARLAEREREQRAELESLRGSLATAVEAERRAATELDALRAADADARARLGAAEAAAAEAREAVRVGDERLRAADRAELEARLGLDAIREQVLVELAGLGELGRSVLGADPGDAVDVAARDADAAEADGASADDVDGSGEAAALERALDGLAVAWVDTPPPTELPSPGRLATLRRRYHELGAGNPFAVSEYEELRRRLDELETQERDLRQAISRTRELIDELNTLIADQFRLTFRALETAFDAKFQQLFGGGFARLSLTDPDDLSATGIEIVARPPGKKAQPLAMLSGGERALTAVALLFAMLEVRPVPFCVLDEVDAALDEANVGRFAEALRDLAAATQFIVITHNRGTIEAADALYGVTVGDDSVSRVISLRLDEAQAIAARAHDPALADVGAG